MPPHQHFKRRLVASSNEALQQRGIRQTAGDFAVGLPQLCDQTAQHIAGHVHSPTAHRCRHRRNRGTLTPSDAPDFCRWCLKVFHFVSARSAAEIFSLWDKMGHFGTFRNQPDGTHPVRQNATICDTRLSIVSMAIACGSGKPPKT